MTLLTSIIPLLLTIPLSLAQQPCNWSQLRNLADTYAESQAAGEVGEPYLTPGLNYTENGITVPITNSLTTDALESAHTHTLIDQPGCAVFLEFIASSAKKDWYIINTQLRFARDSKSGYPIAQSVDTVYSSLTDEGAANRIKWTDEESWGSISTPDQMTREALMAVANSYLDGDQEADRKWTVPCAALMGSGYVSGDNGECYGGYGEGRVRFSNKKFVIDVGTGAVSVMSRGSNGVTASHEFRIEDGKLRYAHAVRRL